MYIIYPKVPEVECKHGVLIILPAEVNISYAESWFYICRPSLEVSVSVYMGSDPLKCEEHFNKNNNWVMQVKVLRSRICVALDQVR
jgi:hypothetical protein